MFLLDPRSSENSGPPFGPNLVVLMANCRVLGPVAGGESGASDGGIARLIAARREMVRGGCVRDVVHRIARLIAAQRETVRDS